MHKEPQNAARAVSLAVLMLCSVICGGVTFAGSAAADHPNLDISDLEGSGTEDDPYVITTAPELQAMEDDLEANYVLGDDIDASGTAQWNDGVGFRPIVGFNGTVNGTGNVIEGLEVNRPSENGAGLFSGMDRDGNIIRVQLRNADITGDFNVGGLVGGANFGTIKNSSVTGTVTGNGNDIGGLVGKNRGVITASSMSGSVTGEFSVGGVVGDNRDGGTVKDSYMTGEVTANRNNVGGIAGANGGIIMNASAKADIKGNVTDGFNVGGLVGVNGKTDTTGTVRVSYATGSVEGDTYVSGLVGQNFNGTIDEAYAVSNIEANSVGGGLVGRNEGRVMNSYWDTQATGQSESAGGATGLTTTEMQGEAARNNMAGLDFETTWQTQPDNYPTLRPLTQDTGQSQTSPDGPTARALQLADKRDPTELTQDDVTAAITRFSRGQPVNNIDPSQDDITVLITLFERN